MAYNGGAEGCRLLHLSVSRILTGERSAVYTNVERVLKLPAPYKHYTRNTGSHMFICGAWARAPPIQTRADGFPDASCLVRNNYRARGSYTHTYIYIYIRIKRMHDYD